MICLKNQYPRLILGSTTGIIESLKNKQMQPPMLPRESPDNESPVCGNFCARKTLLVARVPLFCHFVPVGFPWFSETCPQGVSCPGHGAEPLVLRGFYADGRPNLLQGSPGSVLGLGFGVWGLGFCFFS